MKAKNIYMEDITREVIANLLIIKQNRLSEQNLWKEKSQWRPEDKELFEFIEKLYEVFSQDTMIKKEFILTDEDVTMAHERGGRNRKFRKSYGIPPLTEAKKKILDRSIRLPHRWGFMK